MSRGLKPTILSISLITVMSGAAVAPALGEIARAFPQADETLIKLVLTLASVMIIPFSFISGRICDHWGKRRTLLLGLAVYLVGGMGGGLASSIWALLGTRIVLGMGVGLIMPISTALVGDFYEGEERVRTMGQLSASSNLGGIIAMVLSGWLASLSWRYSFGVYGFALGTALLVFFLLPEPASDGRPGGGFKSLPLAVYLSGAAVLLLMLVFYSIPTNMALFLQANHIGEARLSGMVIALITASGFVAGLVLSRVQGVVGRRMVPAMLGCMAGGFWLLSAAASLAPVVAGVVLIGFSYGSLFPLILVSITGAVPRHRTVLAMAVASSCLFLGQFISPLVLDGLGAIIGTASPRESFHLCALGITAAMAAAFVISFRKPAQSNTE